MIDYVKRPKIDYSKPQQQQGTALLKGQSINLTTLKIDGK